MNIQLTCKIASKKFIKLQTWCAISDIQDDQKFTQIVEWFKFIKWLNVLLWLYNVIFFEQKLRQWFSFHIAYFIFHCIFLQFQVTSLLARKDIDIITPFDYKLYKEDDVVLRNFVRKPTWKL